MLPVVIKNKKSIHILGIDNKELYKSLIEEIQNTITLYNSWLSCIKCGKLIGFGNICDQCFRKDKKVSNK